jgi:hypothetical protein
VTRELAEALKLDMPLPDFSTLPDADLESLNRAYHLLTTGELRTTRLTTTFSRRENARFWSDVVPLLKVHGEIRLRFKIGQLHTFKFLGADASLGELWIDDCEGTIRPVDATTDYSGDTAEVELAAADGDDIVFRLAHGANSNLGDGYLSVKLPPSSDSKAVL